MLRTLLFRLASLAIFLTLTFITFAGQPVKKKPIKALMVGGDASHDFDRWYKIEDVKTLSEKGLAEVVYTDDPSTILEHLPQIDVLILSNNKAIPDPATRQAIFDFLDQGKGLILLHAAIWYNWNDWPEYNRLLVGGGSRGHDKYGPFDVTVIDKKHPLMKKIPAQFNLADELYYHKIDPEGSSVKVLATAQMAGKAESYPSIFTVEHPNARIVGIALGHDAASHEHPAYRTLLQNAIQWAARR